MPSFHCSTKTIGNSYPNGSVIPQRRKEFRLLDAEKLEHLICLIYAHNKQTLNGMNTRKLRVAATLDCEEGSDKCYNRKLQGQNNSRMLTL